MRSSSHIWRARQNQKWNQACQLARGGYGIYCVLCGKESDDTDAFDFHHWDYAQHIGIFVCRKCHDEIHSTAESYPENNDDWQIEAVRNAYSQLVRESPRHLDSEQKEDVEEICRILNLPDYLSKQFTQSDNAGETDHE